MGCDGTGRGNESHVIISILPQWKLRMPRSRLVSASDSVFFHDLFDERPRCSKWIIVLIVPDYAKPSEQVLIMRRTRFVPIRSGPKVAA